MLVDNLYAQSPSNRLFSVMGIGRKEKEMVEEGQ